MTPLVEEQGERVAVEPLKEETSTSGREFPKANSALSSVNMGKQKSFAESLGAELEEERLMNQTFWTELRGRLESSTKATERLLGVFRVSSHYPLLLLAPL